MPPPARMNLRRAASYNNSNNIHYNNQPHSATSSRFGFHHLLTPSSSSSYSSPPPSPSLLPRPAESCRSKRWRRRRAVKRVAATVVGSVRTLVCTGGIIILALWFAVRFLSLLPARAGDDLDNVRRLSMLLPDFPTPVVVSGSRWTVSIPRRHSFPLSIGQYVAMAESCRSLSSSYVDVDEAERAGLLPPVSTTTTVQSGHFVGIDHVTTSLPVCDRSLTFVLESTDAGLGRSLLTLWILFALAEEQKRAFFVDDSRWAYGRYKDIFRPPPRPACRPPPRHQMVPCPARARHLVVSAATSGDVIPALLGANKRSQQANRRRLLDLARFGYRHLFELVEEDAGYVRRRVRQLRERAGLSLPPAPIVGLHVRRGDRHPFEYQYRDTYIPTQVFSDRARWLVEAHYNETKGVVGSGAAVTVLASDDPTVHAQADFSEAVVAQQRIRLASNEEAANGGKTPSHDSDPHFMHRFIEEGQGWEGGFFPLIFWNLGAQRKNNAAAENKRPESPSELTLRLRGLIGRAYVMDLAVLAGASDKVVCAVSAMGCRLLAVMMGWDRAMDRGEWVNVDGGHQGWTGL
ncbi:hypothetical protein L249_3456 [Ophiocordyceps polyrhachis-furcata BCC 54312]|uniref:Uncharacterized protein n=1 Tax=Ophiocordyceps polyrhachis-furcata BCC 54312 TaxID=1330021 RepID=A0A367LM33_9HYPO|nr:hypothetical protein L249_3456 [Ophiocordyceps polyrhachis-furcata BCC 54312]